MPRRKRMTGKELIRALGVMRVDERTYGFS